MHSIRWQLDTVCCHLTCHHRGEKRGVGCSWINLLSKDKYRLIQTNANMILCVDQLENSCRCRRDIFSSCRAQKRESCLGGYCFYWQPLWGTGTASHASIFTGFNTLVPCHIPEHIQISPWHFTHCCCARFHKATIPPGRYTHYEVFPNIRWLSWKMKNIIPSYYWNEPLFSPSFKNISPITLEQMEKHTNKTMYLMN